jgi:hypothetical protein
MKEIFIDALEVLEWCQAHHPGHYRDHVGLGRPTDEVDKCARQMMERRYLFDMGGWKLVRAENRDGWLVVLRDPDDG